MTNVYITIDTEYSALLAQRGASREENYARSIACETPRGAVGIEYQMDVFDRHGLTGIFFVDPMPAMLWGVEAIADIVSPIVLRGHEVQLHIHTEWIALANGLGGGRNLLELPPKRNIADYDHEDQALLLEYGRAVLMEAGAPAPIAFRAGNYGANDDTLRALRWAGMQYDTSHCPGIAQSECGIALGSSDRQVLHHAGAVEVPIGAVESFGGELRHAQITALSAREMLSAVRHARDNGVSAFTLVSHSFELLSRDRMRINHIVKRRFDAFCKGLGRMDGVSAPGYHDAPPAPPRADGVSPVLPLSNIRAVERIAEQALSNVLYGRG